MKERPILFSSEMVRAILDGRKTQTRRVIKFHPLIDAGFSDLFIKNLDNYMVDDCPHGVPGDRLWVRETFACRTDIDGGVEPERARHYTRYRADQHDNGFDPRDEMNWHGYGRRWHPSIFMPRWASRITLEITGVRVERVKEISMADCVAEGISENSPLNDRGTGAIVRDAYADLWDALNAKRGYPWESSPWVWVLEFQRI